MNTKRTPNSDNNSTSNLSTEEREALKNQLGTVTLSYNTLKIILFAIILSTINVNKIRLTLIDKLNNTKCADRLPDTSDFSIITSVLALYGTYIFLKISEQSVNEQSATGVNQSNNSSIRSAQDNYKASIFVFVAALIRFISLIVNGDSSTSEQDENADDADL